MQGDDSAEVVAAATQAIKDNAQRLGLTWQLKTGLVTGIDTVSGRMLVQYDGDTKSIPMVSMAGYQPTNSRVYVLEVPPSGNFIVGTTAAVNPAKLGLARYINFAMAVASTTSAIPVAMPGTPTLTIVKAYSALQSRVEFTFAGTFYANSATEAGAGFYVRDTVNSLTTQIGKLSTPNGTIGVHQQAAGGGLESNSANLAAGSYTYQVQWARINGTGTLQTDGNDMLFVTAKEVPL